MIIVFNSTASAMSLFVNQGQVQAPDRMTPDNGFRPFSKSVALEKLKGPGIFGIGENRVDLRFTNFKPPLPTQPHFEPYIPDGSIRSDYVVFIFANGATLMRSNGEPLQQFFWNGKDDPAAEGRQSATAINLKSERE